jgi:hypothetical protein
LAKLADPNRIVAVFPTRMKIAEIGQGYACHG